MTARVPAWCGFWRVRALPLWVIFSGALGCLNDPPTFAPRGQIPPFIIAGRVEPPLASIYEGPSPFSINVPFRSEDVNEDLEARLYSDLVPGTAIAIPDANREIAAGNFEDLRQLTMDWVQLVGGCHSLTLIMTYVENYDVLTGLPRDDTRAARIVWWLNIADMAGVTRIADCPSPSQVDSVPAGG
jgi:hypothetical protein